MVSAIVVTSALLQHVARRDSVINTDISITAHKSWELEAHCIAFRQFNRLENVLSR